MVPRSRLHAAIALWTATLVATTACKSPAPTSPRPAPAVAATPPASPATSRDRPTIVIDRAAKDVVLEVEAAAAVGATPPSATSPLAPADTAALLARLEPLPDLRATNAAAPAIRPPSLPPPRTGRIQPIQFVVPTGKPVTAAPIGRTPAAPPPPLSEPQILPRGEVDAELELRIRFAEPMIAVAGVGTAAVPPITIAPPVAGTWRWLDTRVLAFTPTAARMAQATAYTVTVAAGAQAISGSRLATPVSGTFSTPPPRITNRFPRRLRPDAPIAIGFDQAVDAARLAPFLRVQTRAGKRLAHRVIGIEEARRLWAADPSIKPGTDLTKLLGEHHVILAPQQPWPEGREAQVIVASGAPSSEGPRLTTKDGYADFDIVPAFRVRGLTCDEAAKPRMTTRCSALGPVVVELSGSIDEATYRSNKFQIAGEPPADMRPHGSSVTLWAPDTVGRSYRIEVGDGLRDVHGQSLVGPRQLAFTTTPQRFQPFVSAHTGLHVLDPRFEIPQWVLHAQAIAQLRIELYRVTPADYFEFTAFEAGKRTQPPGTRVLDERHVVGRRHAANLRIDLRPALAAAGVGHVIAVATATPAPGAKLPRDERRSIAWIQVSKLGVAARIDGDQLSAWIQDVSPTTAFLAPVKDVDSRLLVDGRAAPVASARTDARGHLAFALPALGTATPRRKLPPRRRSPASDDDDDDDDEQDDDARLGYDRPTALLAATRGDDSVFAAVDRHEQTIRTDTAHWYVTDDRFMYKPGEKVYLKGWVRWTRSGPAPALTLPARGERIGYTLLDARSNKIASGDAAISDQGGFSLEVALPANANLGTARFVLSTRKHSTYHPIEIQEFRTPAYSVSLDDDVTHKGAVPLVLGESIEMAVEASYYAGGGLSGAGVRWVGHVGATSYAPPGWDPFTFSPVRSREELFDRYWDRSESAVVEAAGALSGASTASVRFGLAAMPSGRPAVLTVDANVTDLDRQTIRASSRPILVHPSSLYVGLRAAPNTTDRLEAVVTDIDGNPVPGVAVAVTIEGVLPSERERNDAKVVDTQRCTLTSGAAPVACPWRPRDLETAYVATARISDARGRAFATQYAIPWIGRDDSRELDVVPDRASYRPGDTARLDIRTKTVPATAIVTFARYGIIAQRRVELTAPSTIVELPIEPSFLPNVHVVVDQLARRPLRIKGEPRPIPRVMARSVELPVELESARLVMTARPRQPLVEPGAPATFDVEVRHDDRPVAGAEVALIVVDEAVLALSSKSHPDPLAPFYRKAWPQLSAVNTLDLIEDSAEELVGAPGVQRHALDHGGGTGTGYGYGSGRGGMRGRSASAPKVMMGKASVLGIKARKDFRPTAVFSPLLRTDGAGKVSVTVTMPDSLTRYRVIALATARTRLFGKAEGTIVAQRTLNARLVPPRFLTQGDTFALPVVVQNLASEPRTIDVAVRAANLTSIGPAGKRVRVAGGQRAELRFEFKTASRGQAAVQAIAVAGDRADATTIQLPVYEPATTESFATYGVVDSAPQFEQLQIPADIFPSVGGAELEVSSTQLSSLTDAYWYLYAYPYECAEQRSGRMLATAALHDLLDAFATPGRPTRAEIDAQIAKDLKLLDKQQGHDGGWGYFRGMQSDPFVTMQVLGALAAHKASGPMVQNATRYVMQRATALLTKLEATRRLAPAQRTERERLPYEVSLAAAALSTLAATGAEVGARARRLHAAAVALDSYPVDAKARVLALLAGQPRDAAIRAVLLQRLLSAVHETASSATVAASYAPSERMLLVSNTKTSALVLDALIREAPSHAVIVKLARGVLDARRHGRWVSTQDNLAALQAMRRYFDTYEKATPAFTGKLWLGKGAYAEQPFIGRSSARGTATADWAQLPAGTTHDVALVKDGPGRMYYRLGITYAPRRIDLPALDAGFIVRRSYSAIDDKADVTRLPDGRTRVRLGARVLVTVETLATAPRFGVAVVDPLPAGFEPVNEALATSERAAEVEQSRWDYRNMRDNRSEAFVMHLPAGSHRFAYTVRATTPGTFVAAPTKAEEMYSPETFGRSTGTTIVIE